MQGYSVVDFLIRTVLDDEFRTLALTDPQRAFEGYELSVRQRDILTARDGRLLGLLGAAVAPPEGCADGTAPPLAAESISPDLPNLPDVELLLRLSAQAAPTPQDPRNIAYTASLEPRRPEPGPGEATATPDAHSAGMTWRLTIRPVVLGEREGGLEVAYQASITPETSGPATADPPASKTSPWVHRVNSPAARTAAAAVRSCSPDERYDRLLDLIAALQTGDHRG